MKIQCNNCESVLPVIVNANDSKGVLAAKVSMAGFIVKNPILYTGINENFYYCCKPCKEKHYDRFLRDNATANYRLAVDLGFNEINKSLDLAPKQ